MVAREKLRRIIIASHSKVNSGHRFQLFFSVVAVVAPCGVVVKLFRPLKQLWQFHRCFPWTNSFDFSFRNRQIDRRTGENRKSKLKLYTMNVIPGAIISNRIAIIVMLKWPQKVAIDRTMALRMAIGNRRWCNAKSLKIQQMQLYNSNAKQRRPDQPAQPKQQSLPFTTMAMQIAQEMVSHAHDVEFDVVSYVL